jgi:hypothetical protein
MADDDYRHYQTDDHYKHFLSSYSGYTHTFGVYHQPNPNVTPTRGAYAVVDKLPSHHIAKEGVEYGTNQGTMFHTVVQGGHTLTSLMATTGEEHLIPGLIGKAAMHSERTHGRRPLPSANLSEHSAKMVQNLVDRGILRNPSYVLPGDDPSEVQATNDYGRYEGNNAVRTMARGATPENAVPANEHLMGSQFVRRELRATRPGPPPADPNQTELVPADPYKGKKKYVPAPSWPERPGGH